MFTNNEYLFMRVKWLERIGRGIDGSVIDRLNNIHNGEGLGFNLIGVFYSSYPATFRVRQNEEEEEVIVWVKETRIGSETSVPPFPVNECKIMGSVIRDVLIKGISPHFVFPVAQILTNDKAGSDEEEHLVVYNLMEYLPSERFVRFREWIKTMDSHRYETKFDIITAVFQILYNLVVMEALKFSHGDLHLDNVLICPTLPFRATYFVPNNTAYDIPSPVFTVMVDFNHSVVGRSDVFDPHSDLKNFTSHLFKAIGGRQDILTMLFPSENGLRDDLTLLSVSNDQGLLDRCLPRDVLHRYARQFWTPIVTPPTDYPRYMLGPDL